MVGAWQAEARVAGKHTLHRMASTAQNHPALHNSNAEAEGPWLKWYSAVLWFSTPKSGCTFRCSCVGFSLWL